jgi:hypothetical protein
MRLVGLLFFSITLAAVSRAQDTNFPIGPQYLITNPSAQFLHPIATPSLSLEPAPAYTPATTESQPSVEPPSSGSQFQPEVARVLWGDDWVRYVRGASSAAASSEIEITSPQTTPPLPSSFLETGVTRVTDAQSLQASGYGLTLGEVSAYWKAKRHTPRVYTNADIARLHRS